MKNVGVLVLTLLKNQFRGGKVTYDKKGKRKSNKSLYIILACCFAPFLAIIAIQMYHLGAIATAQNSDVHARLVTMFFIVSQGMVLLFGMASLLNNVFLSSDNERLMALPFTSIQIFVAKLTVVYVNELITSAILSLVTLVSYGIGAGFGVSYFLLLILATLIIPIFPLLLECIFAIPLSFIVSKIKGKGFARTILTTILFCLIIFAYIMLVVQIYSVPELNDSELTMEQLAQMIFETLAGSRLQIMEYFVFDYWFAKAMISTSLLTVLGNLFASLGLNVVVFALTLLIALPMYYKSLTQSLEKAQSTRRTEAFSQSKTPNLTMTLVITNLKRIMRESQFGFQVLALTFLLPALLILISLMMTLSPETNELFQLIQGNNTVKALFPLIAWVLMTLMSCSSNVAGMFPISQERTSFYLMKVIPVPVQKQLDAKLILSMAIMAITAIISSVVLVVAFQVSWIYAIILPIATLAYGYGAECLSMIMDLKSPILQWTSFQSSLKNSPNSFFGLLWALIIYLLVALVSVGFIFWFIATANSLAIFLMWGAIIAVGVGFSLVCRQILKNRGLKYFDQIEN